MNVPRISISLLFCAVIVLATSPAAGQTARQWAVARDAMVEQDIVGAGISRPGVITAMRGTPRHEFVPADQRRFAYVDMALPIGEGQTISPPFIVAYMTERLDPQPEDKVLEVGTGSGYQAAVLAGLVRRVYSIEIVESLGARAAETLKQLGYKNVITKIGDGFAGWPEHAPFDKIIVTCSPENVPQPLIEQLRDGGRLIIPLGERFQQTLYVMRKRDGKLAVDESQPTFFVPMTGRAEQLRSVESDATVSALGNGGFEERTSEGQPETWHYLRQATLEPRASRDGGKLCLAFRNATPGRMAQALQTLGVDGSRVTELQVSLWARGRKIEVGASPEQLPKLLVTYFDAELAPIGQVALGPWKGTFDWSHKSGRLLVPPNAHAAIIAIGLLGGTGEFYCDNVEITAASK